MRLRFLFLIIIPAFVFTAFTGQQPVSAKIDCNHEPKPVSWTGSVKSGVNLRDKTCMDSNVVGTLSGGSTVEIVADAHGWYQIELDDGTTGFVWNSFIDVEEKEDVSEKHNKRSHITKEEKSEAEHTIEEQEKKESVETSDANKNFQQRVKGRILLQVENHGEAWYVHPESGKRFYMKDGETAYEMMRAFGLGISNVDLEQAFSGNASVLGKLRGKIVLKVEARGEAYYVHPKTMELHYLKDGKAAYKIMRELSLGIANKDLRKLSSGDFSKYQKSTTKQDTESAELSGDVKSESTPADINIDELNQYWLNKINTLRAEEGLRQLVLDERWRKTATEWAEYMASVGDATHTRPDGKSMHDWIDTKGLDFTERNSEGGWSSNYFTENIAWGIASDASTEEVKDVLDDTLEFYLDEKVTNGPHYRTIYHEDWNSVGTGFAFVPHGDGYKVYAAFHYGSLE